MWAQQVNITKLTFYRFHETISSKCYPWTRSSPETLVYQKKVFRKYFTDRSKEVLLFWIICVINVLCFSCFRVCSLLPCGHLLGKGWPLDPWLLFVMFKCVLSLSHVVSWVRCGTCLYRFLIFAAFLTFIILFYLVLFIKLPSDSLCLRKCDSKRRGTFKTNYPRYNWLLWIDISCSIHPCITPSRSPQ